MRRSHYYLMLLLSLMLVSRFVEAVDLWGKKTGPFQAEIEYCPVDSSVLALTLSYSGVQGRGSGDKMLFWAKVGGDVIQREIQLRDVHYHDALPKIIFLSQDNKACYDFYTARASFDASTWLGYPDSNRVPLIVLGENFAPWAQSHGEDFGSFSVEGAFVGKNLDGTDSVWDSNGGLNYRISFPSGLIDRIGCREILSPDYHPDLPGVMTVPLLGRAYAGHH